MARFSRIKWRFPLESRFGGSMIVSTYKLAHGCFSIFLGQIRAVGKMAQEGYAFRPLRHPGGLPCTGSTSVLSTALIQGKLSDFDWLDVQRHPPLL